VPPPCKGEPPTSPPPYCITKEKNQEKVWIRSGGLRVKLGSVYLATVKTSARTDAYGQAKPVANESRWQASRSDIWGGTL
jgi:hypothetical protein